VLTSQVVGVVNMNEVYVDVDMIMNDKNMNVVNVVNEDTPEQVLLSQVVEVNIVNEDHRDVDVIVDNKTVNVVNVDSVN
jgi:hypothetical protein